MKTQELAFLLFFNTLLLKMYCAGFLAGVPGAQVRLDLLGILLIKSWHICQIFIYLFLFYGKCNKQDCNTVYAAEILNQISLFHSLKKVSMCMSA